MIEDSVDDERPTSSDAVTAADTDGQPSVAVVEAIVEASDRSIVDLEPLGETVDTDALDALFTSRRRGNGRRGEFSFDYEGFHVTVLYDDGVDVLLERHS